MQLESEEIKKLIRETEISLQHDLALDRKIVVRLSETRSQFAVGTEEEIDRMERAVTVSFNALIERIELREQWAIEDMARKEGKE